MVKPETIKLNSTKTASVAVVHRSSVIEPESLDRASNGAWFVTVTVSLRYRLVDGRTVIVDKRLRLRGEQEGKRPNPNPFGRKTKRKKAVKA